MFPSLKAQMLDVQGPDSRSLAADPRCCLGFQGLDSTGMFAPAGLDAMPRAAPEQHPVTEPRLSLGSKCVSG